ncbi:MAG: hypothetical protein Q9199_003991 [Rusavskia elegans]
MSISGQATEVIPPGIFPAPPGVTPNYIDPDWNDCGIIPLMCIFIPLSTIFLALRLYTKARIINVVGWEDIAMIAAWLCTAGHEACLIYSLQKRILAIHTWNLTIPDYIPNAKATAAAVTLYIPAVGLPKISILLFYLRLNPSRGFRYGTFAVMAITTAYMISAILAQLLQCNLVRKFWTPTIPGTCINTNPLYLSNSIINTVIDFLVLLLPVPMIVRLQVNTRTKLVLAAIFSLCSGTVVVSALRIWANTVYQKSTDILWDTAPVLSISVVELNLMVVCGSIMVLRPFCRQHLPFLLGSGKSRPTEESPANQGIHYDGLMGPRSKSGYRTKVSGGSGGASAKRSLWGGLGTNRTGGADDDEDMESLSTELRMLPPHAIHAREKSTTHTGNKSRGPWARQGVNETSKAEPWQDYEYTQSLGHVGARDSGNTRDPYAQSAGVDDLEHGIVKTVSLDIR